MSGAVSDIEGDEGMLVPEPGCPPHRTSHQENACQYRNSRLHQVVSEMRTKVRLITLRSFTIDLPLKLLRCRFEQHLLKDYCL